nr:immunoglobulin light chain junction region [Macaca mulatta]
DYYCQSADGKYDPLF